MKPPNLRALLDRLQPSPTTVLGSAAIAVGLLVGVGIWLFKLMIHGAEQAAHHLTTALDAYGVWLHPVPTLIGGLLVGLILVRFVGHERHHGVAGIIESVALAGGRLRYWRIPAKTIAAALAIGSGASVGPEDPSVQIGANAGSMVGQNLRLSDERTRVLVAAGAASGVAAAFNAPIAGVFFALEIILGEISGSALGVVLLASVVSSVFTQAVSGPQPAFSIPISPYFSSLELPFYLGLGLLAGPWSALYVRLIYWAQDLFGRWTAPRWLKPAAAGLLVGSVGIWLPQIQGVGYITIEQLLDQVAMSIPLLLILVIAKTAMTAVSVGGGFPGGVFAPALFIGATLGGAYGALMDRLVPGMELSPSSFALVGMAALLAGTIHAPLTAILLLFEMTNDYRIILPLMLAVTVALFISQRIQRDSVYMLGLARKGIRIERGRDVEVLEAMTVGEVMDTTVATLTEQTPLDQAAIRLDAARTHGMPVVDAGGRLTAILTIQDIERGQSTEPPATTVGDACTRELLIAHADESLGAALRRMSTRDIGRLPVVARDDPSRLVGVLRRSNVIRAYDAALIRRARLRHRAQQVRLGEISGVEIHELVIAPHAAVVGRTVGSITWPQACVLATLRRGSRLLIPRGDTVLHAHDVLAVVADDHALAAIRPLLTQPQTP